MSSTAAGPVLCRLLGDPLLMGPGGAIRIRSALQRTLLLRLAAARGALVDRTELVSALWPTSPPRTSLELLSTHAARLRALLAPHLRPGDEPIPRSESGYRLDLGLVRIDIEELTRAAERATDSDPAALAESRRALGFLTDSSPAHQSGQPWLSDAVTRAWDEAREICRLNVDAAAAIDDCGIWEELRPTLDLLVEQAPFDEPVLAWRLQSLGQTGRVAEALCEMDRVRGRLRDELGASPSTTLTTVFDQILQQSGPPTPGPPTPGPPVPQQVPPPPADFTGRSAQLVELAAHLESPEPQAARQLLITGAAGVGKSALAAQVADACRSRFADGQCYIDFTDGAEHRLDLSSVLTAMLGQFGLAGSEIPERIPDQLALLRSVTADLAVLWVLDNVGARHRVNGLIPTSASSAVIVTSRSIHPDLMAARHCELPGMSSDEARDLLAGMIGSERLDREASSVADLLTLCEGLPWALHLSGRQLMMHPERSIDRLVHRLSDSGRRLEDFSVGGGLRSALRHSVDQLRPEAQRAFAALGVLRTDRAQSWMVGSILDIYDEVAASLLEDLVEARLIEEHRSEFTVTDLVREYALERWQETDRQPAARSVPGRRQIG